MPSVATAIDIARSMRNCVTACVPTIRKASSACSASSSRRAGLSPRSWLRSRASRRNAKKPRPRQRLRRGESQRLLHARMGGRDPLVANPPQHAGAVPPRFRFYERRSACLAGADAVTNGAPAHSRENVFTAGSGIIAAAFDRGDAARTRTDDERSGAGHSDDSAKCPGAAAQHRGAHQCCAPELGRAHGSTAPAARICDASRRARTGANHRSTRQRG